MAELKHWWDYEMAGIPFEDWDVLARSEWYEDIQLKREEQYDREHGYDDEGA